MIIAIESPGEVRILEAGHLKRCSVSIGLGVQDAEARTALTDFGELDGDFAWLAIDELRNRASVGMPGSWLDQFQAMIDYAAEHGWVDESRGAVRAHVARG